MYILGIWDGHDSGAAIVRENKILVAINEERISRRKLDITFPEKSIQACLEYLGLSPPDITYIAISTFDFAKTLSRLLPNLKEEYYQIRRRKKNPGLLKSFKKISKYKLTEFGPSNLTKSISHAILKNKLEKLGFGLSKVYLIDHHQCHAATAAFCSGFDECAVITLDGIGDGLSGSISLLRNNKLTLIETISGKSSLGVFFEHITNLLNMRELEDEGKVMALANYSYPIKDSENPLLNFFFIEGINIKAKYGPIRMYRELKKILWRLPSEQFAYCAQRTLETKISELVKNIMLKTGQNRIALAGGIFSNIKVNMCLSKLSMVSDCFIFPHMGDGGLALGAALMVNNELKGVSSYPLNNIFLGPDFSEEQIKSALDLSGLEYKYYENIEQEAARIIAEKNIVFWFQGRMEYGPRALGNRSILAKPDSQKIRDLLNLKLKMRVWYQPFCPTMLEEEAKNYLIGYKSPNLFMTMAYMVKDDKKDDIKGILGVDGSCRPQIIQGNESLFGRLLQNLKKITGKGVALNTSFNIHGEPLVCSPQDAINTFKKCGSNYLVMGNYLARNRK